VLDIWCGYIQSGAVRNHEAVKTLKPGSTSASEALQMEV